MDITSESCAVTPEGTPIELKMVSRPERRGDGIYRSVRQSVLEAIMVAAEVGKGGEYTQTGDQWSYDPVSKKGLATFRSETGQGIGVCRIQMTNDNVTWMDKFIFNWAAVRMPTQDAQDLFAIALAPQEMQILGLSLNYADSRDRLLLAVYDRSGQDNRFRLDRFGDSEPRVRCRYPFEATVGAEAAVTVARTYAFSLLRADADAFFAPDYFEKFCRSKS